MDSDYTIFLVIFLSDLQFCACAVQDFELHWSISNLMLSFSGSILSFIAGLTFLLCPIDDLSSPVAK
jgi:hypothetical protein